MSEHRIELSNPFFQSMISVALLAVLNFPLGHGTKAWAGKWDWTELGLTKLLWAYPWLFNSDSSTLALQLWLSNVHSSQLLFVYGGLHCSQRNNHNRVHDWANAYHRHSSPPSVPLWILLNISRYKIWNELEHKMPLGIFFRNWGITSPMHTFWWLVNIHIILTFGLKWVCSSNRN